MEAPSPLVSRCARYRDGFLNRIVPWENIDDDYWDSECDKSLLVECVAARLNPCPRDYGSRLECSRGRILLQTMPGTEMYRYRLVRTLARQLQVPLLELQTHDFAAKDVERDNDALTHDSYLAIEALCDVLESHQSIIVYFPDPFCWLSSASSMSTRAQFFVKVKEMFDQLSKRKVLICGQNKSVAVLQHRERTLMGPNTDTEGNNEDEMKELFTNVVYILPPKNEDIFEQIIKDNETITWRRNFSEIHKVLKEHDIMSDGLELVDIKGLVLDAADVEKIVSWATNHYLSSCHLPSVKDGRLNVPTESFEVAISRLKEKRAAVSSKNPPMVSSSLINQSYDLRSYWPKIKAEENSPTVSSENSTTDSSENSTTDSSKISPMDLATDEYEKSFVSAVVSPGEIGVKFNDVGALEDVKSVLQELLILPIKRPQLFSRGNLLKPCKGLLLFGPPGTGKTLIAKAIATEAGANFISVTPSSLTGKWYGEEEQLTRALFSFARKLTPVVIFLDEIDALLRARNGHSEEEASRRMKNEFMAAWDGLNSNESQRIIVIGATNRPFDLDDAVIRRMPRRIFVDLPDANNRLKILKTILAKEDLEPGFCFERLAEDTDGYSGSDLKNLSVAAAYRPVQDLLAEEKEGDVSDEDVTLRPLKLDDFILSKAKVRKSVACDSSSLIELKKWNEQYGEDLGLSSNKSPKGLATGEYETSFISAVISPSDIGVKFDDVGALEDVKRVLQELVIHPIKRPQLFSFGNLLKPCKGLLLFGPPGTGKTLIAKAIATEAGANFISVSPSSLTGKWYGEEEKLAAALFSFARKLTPVIIFLDEVDALLGARNGYSEHEASRRMKNEFMAAWDGLSSNDSQRILVLGATNRPFDLDDAVIRRMPRRIYVDLPDANNRLKILKIILSKENLEPGFCFEQLANDTEGYSGSDLKNLCVAAAYRPVQELLEKENKVSATDTSDEEAAPTLRPLKLDDFIRSKAKVGKSVAHDSSSLIELRKWNEQYGEGGSRQQYN